MARILWLHSDLDPVRSGELRRLGVPAVAVEDDDCTSLFAAAGLAAQAGPCDLAILPLRAANALPLLRGSAADRVILEVDARAASKPAAAEVLGALGGRILGVVARDPRTAAWVGRVLGPETPLWLIPDPAVRAVELAAAALQFETAAPIEAEVEISDDVELWFAEPGDHLDSNEVRWLATAWGAPRLRGDRRVVVAPEPVLDWLIQAGVRAQMIEWGPTTLQRALSSASVTMLGPEESYCAARRQVMALRGGAPAIPPLTPPAAAFEPARVGAAWREVIDTVMAATLGETVARMRVLVLLDLIQDLDPLLPLIDALRAKPQVVLTVAVSSWLHGRSPRVIEELGSRDLPFQLHERSRLIEGSSLSLDGVDAVLVAAESSLAAHARAHATVQQARRASVPTFTVQHGVENVGLHPVLGDEDATIAADHMFVWFPWERTPSTTPAALRPRLRHVGRPKPAPMDLADLAGAFAAFDRLVAVFENLHWNLYTPAWRARFLADCTDFAFAHPSRAVILKPHHAGLWSVKNRHLIPQWPPNLIVADPTDPFWEPYTAAALVELADAVITTPSTVALDAAQGATPVAVAAYGLDLPFYLPLPLLHRLEDWTAFLDQAGTVEDAGRRAAFMTRSASGRQPAEAAAAAVVSAAQARRRFRKARPAERGQVGA